MQKSMLKIVAKSDFFFFEAVGILLFDEHLRYIDLLPSMTNV